MATVKPKMNIKKNLITAKIDTPSPIGIIGLLISVHPYLRISKKLSFVSANVVFATPIRSLYKYLNNSINKS